MINVKNYSIGYKNKEILKDLNFTAKEGEVTVIMGPNGVGKTTFLKSLAGIVEYKGDLYKSGNISYLNQEIFSDNSFTVFETVLLGKIESLSIKVADDDIEDVNKILKLLNLSDFAKEKIKNLSGGQRQKVFIAQALLKEPDILLLDEPTSSLDIKNQYEILKIITELTKEKNLTTIISIHQMDLIERFADYIVVFHNKEIYSKGKKEDIFCEEMFRDVYGIKSEIETNGKRYMFNFDI